MTDQSKREWERAAEADPDDIEARAKFLTRELRAGKISREDLRLAAIAGDKGACLVEGNCENIAELDTRKWFEEMGKHSKEARIRIMLAVLRELFHQNPGENDDAQPVREAIEDYINDPTNERLKRISEIGFEVFPVLTSPEPSVLVPWDDEASKTLLLEAIGKRIREYEADDPMESGLVDDDTNLSDEVKARGLAYTLVEALRRYSHDLPSLQEAVRSEIVPWALGADDPIKKYAQDRQNKSAIDNDSEIQ